MTPRPTIFAEGESAPNGAGPVGLEAGGGVIPRPAWTRHRRAAKMTQRFFLVNFRPANWRGRQGVG